jgi:hypothetical protein
MNQTAVTFTASSVQPPDHLAHLMSAVPDIGTSITVYVWGIRKGTHRSLRNHFISPDSQPAFIAVSSKK